MVCPKKFTRPFCRPGRNVARSQRLWAWKWGESGGNQLADSGSIGVAQRRHGGSASQVGDGGCRKIARARTSRRCGRGSVPRPRHRPRPLTPLPASAGGSRDGFFEPTISGRDERLCSTCRRGRSRPRRAHKCTFAAGQVPSTPRMDASIAIARPASASTTVDVRAGERLHRHKYERMLFMQKKQPR